MTPSNTLNNRKRYAELIALTQLLLLREHKLSDKCVLSRAAFQLSKPKSRHATPNHQKKIETGNIEPLLLSSTPLPTTLSTPAASPIALISEAPVVAVSPVITLPLPAPIVDKPVSQIAQVKPSASVEKKTIHLEPLHSAPEQSFDASYMQFFKEHFPTHSLSTTVPNDQKARRVKDAWMAKNQILPVLILSFNEQDQTLLFLKNIAKAINLLLAPACVISGAHLEKNQEWETILSTPALRLIIACDYELYLHPGLMKHYSQDKQSSKHLLKHTPLLLLSDLALYMKKPELKQLLWNAIRAEFPVTAN